MIRLIVADDEEKVCQLICHLIDFQGLGIELVGTADNGLSALALIEEKKPDLVLTDIRMPGCSGLELLKRARETNPNAEFIIISGYSHFEYAQTAIQYGISDYILKPINQQQLSAALEKACRRCRQRQEEQAQFSRLQERVDQSRRIELIWRDMESGQMPETTAACNEKYGTQFADEVYQVFCIRIDFRQNQFINYSYADYVFDQLQAKAQIALESQVAVLCREFQITAQEECMYGILNYQGDRQWDVRNVLSSVLQNLSVELHSFEKIQIHLSVSPQGHSASALPLCLKQAQAAMEQRLLMEDSQFIEAVPEDKILDVDGICARFREGAEKSLDLLSEESLKGYIQKLWQEMRDSSGQQHLAVVRRAYYIFLLSGVFQNKGNLPMLEKKRREFERKTKYCSSAQNLLALLCDTCVGDLTELRERLNQEKKRPVEQAKQYIQTHYAEPLSLDDVCQEVGFSISYFSALFRRETGQTFLEYLTEVRMEQAKKLFRETKMSMEKICEMVGFSDYKRFAKKFKKETGISPKEYRSLYS